MKNKVAKIDISEIDVIPLQTPQKGLLGFVSFTINNAIRMNDIAIHSDLKNNSLRLVFPDKKLKNGKSIPIFYPISNNVYEQLRKEVSVAYCSLFGGESENLVNLGDDNDKEEN